MVVPLYSRDRLFGAMTFDRTLCQSYSPEIVALAGIYGEALGMALHLAEQGRVLESARQAIHELSPRRDHPFVKLNCAALPVNLVESELFGHVKGSFSGAETARDGRFLTADGGTLLLDELGELPLEVQAKLLRVLQEGTFEPVGSDRSQKVDVRLLAATNVDLEKAASAGKFREDLYFRLSIFPLRLPPLRERLEDLEELTTNLLTGLHQRTGRGPWSLSERALEELRQGRWPGNVRQLQNVLERATILGQPGVLDLPTSPPSRFSPPGPSASRRFPIESQAENERAYFSRLLSETGGRIYGKDGAAKRADMKPSTLQARLKKLGLNRRDFDPRPHPGE